MNPINIKIGDRFGRLVVTGEADRHITSTGQIKRIIRCQCDCGRDTKVFLSALRNSKIPTNSCGCLQAERAKNANTQHGLSQHSLYGKLEGMKKRCYNPKVSGYHRYGGRGIKICEEWLNNFMSFYNWAMANGWKEGLQIDRINNDGNYEPNNCRFVTSAVNNRNQSTTKLTWDDVNEIRNTKLLNPKIKINELAASFGIKKTTVSKILNNKIWQIRLK